MADLERERRKRPVWPWLLGLALLVALIWMGAEMLGDDEPEDTFATAPAAVDEEPMAAPDAAASTIDRPADVEQFRSTCGTASTVRDEMDPSHAHEARCLSQLAAAVAASTERDTVRDEPLEQRLNTLRQNAQSLTQDPESTGHAAQLREAFQEAASVLERVAETREDVGEELRTHVSQLREAADDFERNELLLEQKRAAAEFFEHAAAALDVLARERRGASSG